MRILAAVSLFILQSCIPVSLSIAIKGVTAKFPIYTPKQKYENARLDKKTVRNYVKGS